MRKQFLAAVAVSLLAGSAIAAPVLFVEDAEAMPQGNAQNLTDFQLGESVLVEFFIDDATPAEVDGPDATSVDYFDPLGQIILRGAMSGAEVFLDDGVRFELSNFDEFDLSSFPEGPLELGDLVLAGDTVFSGVTDVFLDPFYLAGSLSLLDDILGTGGSSVRNIAVNSTGIVAFLVPEEEGGFIFDALEFGPVATPVPVPAGLPLLLGALGVFAVLRRRR